MPLPASVSSALLSLSTLTPRALKSYAYGTSGFRGPAHTLDAVCMRMGVLAALRSWAIYQARGEAAAAASVSAASAPAPARQCPIVGLVVTASHNAGVDNGVKLVDASGEMMLQSWEAVATEVANAAEDALPRTVEHILERFGLQGVAEASFDKSGPPPRVFVARDTRTSSPKLNDLVLAGARALGAEVQDFGLATTPQLHWVVREANEGRTATLDAYYKQLNSAFRKALACKPDAASSSGSSAVQLPPTVVDCANGVGTHSVGALAPYLKDVLALETRNTNVDDMSGLNENCGAEHVQKGRTLPANFSLNGDRDRKCAALDGDADRLVYFYVSPSGEFRLLDGDKIIALYTTLLRDLLAASGLKDVLRLGIVQTAYANGASTLFMQNQLGVPVCFTNTGVKHLHHRAVEFDIGVYFESNGHGTVVFSHRAHQLINQAVENTKAQGERAPQHLAALCLQSLLDLINQCIGDAVSDLLLVEVALYHRNWCLSDWDALYEDLPSVMLKVLVKDRTVISTTDAERRCVTPAGLQDAIDALVAAAPAGSKPGTRRAFVRPSGTEDVVRVYAEATTREEVDKLAADVCAVTAKLAGGV